LRAGSHPDVHDRGQRAEGPSPAQLNLERLVPARNGLQVVDDRIEVGKRGGWQQRHVRLNRVCLRIAEMLTPRLKFVGIRRGNGDRHSYVVLHCAWD